MSELPTLIIMAQPADSHRGSSTTSAPRAITWFDSLGSCIMKGQSCGMPIMVVASSKMAQHATRFIDAQCVVHLNCANDAHSQTYGNELIKGVATAVVTTAQSTGWLLVPADLPMLRSDTLRTMGEALRHHPIVFPEYRASRGHLIGFSAEFFSELIRLQCEHDFKRLVARYPALGIEVDDAGVLNPTSGAGQHITQQHPSHLLQPHLE